eukprot:2738387-Pyramimonas_sp.AAC.2
MSPPVPVTPRGDLTPQRPVLFVKYKQFQSVPLCSPVQSELYSPHLRCGGPTSTSVPNINIRA